MRMRMREPDMLRLADEKSGCSEDEKRRWILVASQLSGQLWRRRQLQQNRQNRQQRRQKPQQSALVCVCMPCTLDWHSPHRHSHAFSALKCWPELSEFIVFQASFFLSFLLIQTVHSRTTPAGRKSSSQPFVFTRFHSLLFKFDLIASAVPSRRCWRWPKNSHLIFTLAYQRLPRQCLCFTPVGFI